MGGSRGKRTGGPTAAALATWHRRLGIGAALFVAWLAASGILLNHTDDLGLDQRYASAGWLLDWYGIEAPERIEGYRTGEHWVSRLGERLYFDARPLAGEHGELHGAVGLNGEIAVAAGERLLLLTPEGRLIEALGAAHGLPGGITGIGLRDGDLVLRTADGAYATGDAFIDWRRIEAAGAEWSQPAALPERLRERLVADYRGRLLTLERVLLDLHSGRLFGAIGVLLIDAAAIGFLLLAFTGLWMWLKRNNGASTRPRGRKR